MQRTFTTADGKQVAPDFFAVYHRNDGSRFSKIQNEISEYNLDEYDNITRIELYKNGTENLAPEQIDTIRRQ